MRRENGLGGTCRRGLVRNKFRAPGGRYLGSVGWGPGKWLGARGHRGSSAAELEKGRWRTAKEAYAWLKERFDVKFSLAPTYRCLKKLGGRLKVTRPSHIKKGPLKVISFQETLALIGKGYALPN